MHKSLALGATLAALASAGCTSDHVVGRYHDATCFGPDAGAGVACNTLTPRASASVSSIVSLATPPAGPASTPADHALAACVPALAATNPTAAVKGLCATLLGNPPPQSTSSADRTLFHRTLIVTVRKEGPFNPADRIEATDVTIETPEARFDTWDTVATAYTTVNAGTVQLTQARGATEGLSLGAPATFPFTASGTLGGSQTDTRVENFTATTQVETLTATIGCHHHCLTIRRQGGTGLDLTGNTVIKVDMTYCPWPEIKPGVENHDTDACVAPDHLRVFSVDAYRDPKSKWLSPASLALSSTYVSAPPPKLGTDGLQADVSLTYTLRHITGGDATYEEKDDRVEERTVSVTPATTVTLIPGRDAAPTMFGIHQTAGMNAGHALKITREGYDTVGACFDTYDGATDFLAYLRVISARKSKVAAFPRIGAAAVNLRFVDPNPMRPSAPLLRKEVQSLQVEPGCT